MLPPVSAAMQKLAAGQEIDVKMWSFWMNWPAAQVPAEYV
jgi:hypothetical protein